MLLQPYTSLLVSLYSVPSRRLYLQLLSNSKQILPTPLRTVPFSPIGGAGQTAAGAARCGTDNKARSVGENQASEWLAMLAADSCEWKGNIRLQADTDNSATEEMWGLWLSIQWITLTADIKYYFLFIGQINPAGRLACQKQRAICFHVFPQTFSLFAEFECSILKSLHTSYYDRSANNLCAEGLNK